MLNKNNQKLVKLKQTSKWQSSFCFQKIVPYILISTFISAFMVFYLYSFLNTVIFRKFFRPALFTIFTLGPFYFLLTSSMRPGRVIIQKRIHFDISADGMNFNNYSKLITDKEGYYFLWYLNSLVITAFYTFSSIFFAAFGGYGFAKYQFKFKNFSYILVLSELMIPAFGAMAILQSLRSWNDFAWPFIALRSDEMFTFPIELSTLLASYENNYDMLLAGPGIAVIAIIIVYLINHKPFINGLTDGIKG